jgi:formate hydrogenlyase subunit 4
MRSKSLGAPFAARRRVICAFIKHAYYLAYLLITFVKKAIFTRLNAFFSQLICFLRLFQGVETLCPSPFAGRFAFLRGLSGKLP